MRDLRIEYEIQKCYDVGQCASGNETNSTQNFTLLRLTKNKEVYQLQSPHFVKNICLCA